MKCQPTIDPRLHLGYVANYTDTGTTMHRHETDTTPQCHMDILVHLRALPISCVIRVWRAVGTTYETDAREICNTILGLVLKIQKEAEGETEEEYDYVSCIATIYRYKSMYKDITDTFEQYLMSELRDKDEMLLLRWMDFQIQLLHEDAKDLDTYYDKVFQPMEDTKRTCPRNFLDVSTLSSHFDKLIWNNSKFANQSHESKDDDKKSMHDELIFNTIVKISEAREKLSLSFAAKYRMVLDWDTFASYVPEAIMEASDCFDNLLLKLPVNYDMTLRQWVEQKLKPRFEEYVSKLKLKKAMKKMKYWLTS